MRREPATVNRAGALQIDAPELRLVGRELAQTMRHLSARLWQASLQLEDLRSDQAVVQANRDRVGLADRPYLAQQGISRRWSVQVELELGRQ